MNIFQSIFLGILQGITEFLPISSSGHLVIFQKIFGFKEPPIFFDTMVHFGTVVVLLVFFREKIKKILLDTTKEIKEKKVGESMKLIWFLFLGTIPIVVVGIFLQEKIEKIFDSLLLLGFSFLFTSIILFLTALKKEHLKNIQKAKPLDALFIGIFQAIAILPGVSRSGSTISAGIFRNLKKEDAFDFSFFLGIIAILGATILQVFKIVLVSSNEIFYSIFGFLFAAISGYFALKILRPIVLKGKLHYFGFYCFFIGTFCLIFSFL